MRPDGLRLSTRHRAWVNGTFVSLFLSGAGWWVLRTWFQTETDFGQQPHPMQRRLLVIHGGIAMLALVIAGTLIPLHVKRGWLTGLNRKNGITLIALASLLTASGYALYYTGDESLRLTASYAHMALGAVSPLVLFWHIRQGRRSRKH